MPVYGLLGGRRVAELQLAMLEVAMRVVLRLLDTVAYHRSVAVSLVISLHERDSYDLDCDCDVE